LRVLYIQVYWRFCIYGFIEGFVYTGLLRVLYIQVYWRFCIYGFIEGFVYTGLLKVLYIRVYWRFCIYRFIEGFVYTGFTVSIKHIHLIINWLIISMYTVIGKGRGHGPFDTYSFVILCRCPIQKLKGPYILVFTKTTLKWPIECCDDGAVMAHNHFLFPDHCVHVVCCLKSNHVFSYKYTVNKYMISLIGFAFYFKASFRSQEIIWIRMSVCGSGWVKKIFLFFYFKA
jgi:hypothetical protein